MKEKQNDSVHAECPKHKGQPEIACVECRVEEKPEPILNPRLISINEFRGQGYLQELNRQFLHPLGLALSINVENDGTETIAGIWDYRDDPEGIVYDLDASSSERLERFRENAENVETQRQKLLTARNELFGTDYGIEPIP